jgi:hypothetical protein
MNEQKNGHIVGYDIKYCSTYHISVDVDLHNEGNRRDQNVRGKYDPFSLNHERFRIKDPH